MHVCIYIYTNIYIHTLQAMLEALLAQNVHPHLCVQLTIGIEEAVARVYGNKEYPEFPKPHRLPFYPYLDPHQQRREMRALRALNVDAPNPNPRDSETGKPILPAPTNEEMIETANSAEAAIKDKLSARLTASVAAMDAMKAKFEHHCVPVTIVNAKASWEKKELAVDRATARFLKHGASALASPVAVSPEKANELLALRLRRWSKFGSTCPVMLGRYKRAVTPAAKVALPDAFPVVYGPHIYLCKTHAARQEMLADPVPLSRQRPPQPAALHRIVVLGAPKSGRSSLAASVAKDMGVALIDACSAVRDVLSGISHLSATVKRNLRTGQPLDPMLVAECVCAVALRYPGWVLDGFPATREQAELLAARNLGMTRVLVLEASDYSTTARASAQLAAKHASGIYMYIHIYV